MDWPIGCSLVQCLDYGPCLTQEKQPKSSREADTIVTQLIQGPVTTGLGANLDKQQQGVLIEWSTHDDCLPLKVRQALQTARLP